MVRDPSSSGREAYNTTLSPSRPQPSSVTDDSVAIVPVADNIDLIPADGQRGEGSVLGERICDDLDWDAEGAAASTRHRSPVVDGTPATRKGTHKATVL